MDVDQYYKKHTGIRLPIHARYQDFEYGFVLTSVLWKTLMKRLVLPMPYEGRAIKGMRPYASRDSNQKRDTVK